MSNRRLDVVEPFEPLFSLLIFQRNVSFGIFYFFSLSFLFFFFFFSIGVMQGIFRVPYLDSTKYLQWYFMG